MGKIWILTSANLKKNKGQAATFFLLVLLAAMLLNLGLLISLRYSENFDEWAEKSQSADVIAAMQDGDGSYVDAYHKELLSDYRTEEIEKRQVLFLGGSCSYRENEMPHTFAVLKESDPQQMGKVTYLEKSEEKLENPIYLPWLFQTGGGYQLGDAFTLKVFTQQGEEKIFEYTVAGFFDEPLLATINSTTTGLLLEDEAYESLAEQFAGSLKGTMFMVRLADRSENEAYCSLHLPSPPEQGQMWDAVFYDVLKRSRTVTSSIGALILVAFSVIVTGVMLVVVKFRIGNYIEEDMPNIGAQKAIGYQSRQIMLSILLQFLSVGAAGILAGIGSSYAVLPFVSQMFAAQTGLVWQPGFDFQSAGITLIFLLAMTALVSLASARKIRNLSPIVALRIGISTHSFKKNFFPLDKSRGSITWLLAMKAIRQNIRRNLLLSFIIAAISFVAVFAGVLYLNIALQFDDFMVSTVGEVCDVRIECSSPQAAREVLKDVLELPGVKKAYTSFEGSLLSEEDYQAICYVAGDFNLYDNQDMIYQGRFPKHENETAVGGLLAGKLEKEPGDTILLELEGRQEEYLITGLIQGSNYMGHDVALTEEGYARLVPDNQVKIIAVYLDKGQDTEAFLREQKEAQGNKIAAIYDYEKRIRASLGTYQSIVTGLVAVIALVTGAIVALILSMVIRTAILRKRRELGIQKAIGFTTGQLIWQTAFQFLPVVLSGAALGNTVGYFIINPSLSLMFQEIGIMKVNYQIPLPMLLGICTGITAFGFGISVLVASRIQKITPYAFITE